MPCEIIKTLGRRFYVESRRNLQRTFRALLGHAFQTGLRRNECNSPGVAHSLFQSNRARSWVAAAQELPVVPSVELQPLAAQFSRLLETLQFLGEPLPADESTLKSATDVTTIQKVLDRHWPRGR